MSDEKRYLVELEKILDHYSEVIKEISGHENAHEEISAELNAVIERENILREECSIGERFNVLHTQLSALLNEYHQDSGFDGVDDQDQEVKTDVKPTQDGTFVYVYLYNAQGALLKSWQKLLLPSALIEHSVNRPIYAHKEQIESVIRSKPNKEQHAYIEIEITESDIIEPLRGHPLKDQFGYPLLRLRQGSLQTNNIKNFVHNGKEYRVADEGIIS